MNNLRNKKQLEILKEKKEKEIVEYNCRLEEIDKVLEEYKISVSAGRKISLISGTLLTLFLNTIEQAIFGQPGSSLFTVTLPSTLPVLIISTINMIPLFLGIKLCIDTPKKIEREMDISVKELNDEKSSCKFLIKSNHIEISRLKLRIDEADYNLRESCIDYGSIDDDIVNEDEKVLKLVKKV